MARRSRDVLDQLDQRVAVVDGGLDVEEDELVGSRVRVRGAELDRVADIAQALELDALDNATAGHVEAGNEACERHYEPPADVSAASGSPPPAPPVFQRATRASWASRKRTPGFPLFSGWNWTPTKLPCAASTTMPSE